MLRRLRQHHRLTAGRTGAAAAEHPKSQSRIGWAAGFSLAWWAAQGGVIESTVYDDSSLGEAK